jgi:transcriptional regulator with XRE-family HTH domain
MRRSVDPDYDFEKEKYAEVLRRAIGDRSISMFSKDVGISAGYVSRYLNLKCDVTPTIATIKKIANATKMVTYAELLEAAGYDSEKYLEFEEGDRELFGEDKPSGFMSFFTSVFSAVTRADFNWKFSSVANNGKEPFSVQIDGAPFDVWYFIPVNKADITKEDIMTALSGTELAIAPGNKVSFMTSSKSIFSRLKEMDFCILSLFLSVLLVDAENGNISEEIYLKTASEIKEEDKKKYSISDIADDDLPPFYSL